MTHQIGTFSVTLALVILPALVTPTRGEAQTEMLILLRGTDTIAVERIDKTPSRLDGELVDRIQKLRWSYSATLDDGLVTKFHNEVRRADADPTSPALQTALLVFTGDSVILDINPGPNQRTQRLGTRTGALPYINPSFALFELIVARGLATGKDSTSVPMFLVSGGQTVDVPVMRNGADSVVVVAGTPSRFGWHDGRLTGGTVPAQGLTILLTEADTGAMHVPKPDYSVPADAPYTAESVTVPTPMGHTLGGTLTLPKRRSGRVPAIITITGSGAQDRDEEIPFVRGYRPFRQIADTLGHAGIAVLRMDDRGFGESGGANTAPTTDDLADDIRAGVAYLHGRPEIDPTRIVLVGHSEGAIIAPIVAAADPTIRAIVLMAGTSRTGRIVIEYQNRYAIEHSDQITAEQRDSVITAAMKTVDSLAARSPWLKHFLEYDPKPTASRVTVPVLILQGETDRQVTADQAEELAAAIRSGGNTNVTVHLFPEANHLFVQDPIGSPTGYPQLPEGRIRNDVIIVLVGWLSDILK